MIVASTDRLILRRWRESDRRPFCSMNADPRVMEFYPSLMTREQSEALILRMEADFEQHGFSFCAVELRRDHSFIGLIGLSYVWFQTHFTPCVEIGWRLSADAWGQGLATEGAREIVRFAFETLGLEGIVAFTALSNVRSRRVMQKLGMSHDPADDFDHPRIPEDHQLRRHVLYRLRRARYDVAISD